MTTKVVECGNTGFYTTRLQKLIEEEQKNGLIGFRLFPSANRDVSVDDIAKESVLMHEGYLAGEYADITDQVL